VEILDFFFRRGQPEPVEGRLSSSAAGEMGRAAVPSVPAPAEHEAIETPRTATKAASSAKAVSAKKGRQKKTLPPEFLPPSRENIPRPSWAFDKIIARPRTGTRKNQKVGSSAPNLTPRPGFAPPTPKKAAAEGHPACPYSSYMGSDPTPRFLGPFPMAKTFIKWAARGHSDCSHRFPGIHAPSRRIPTFSERNGAADHRKSFTPLKLLVL